MTHALSLMPVERPQAESPRAPAAPAGLEATGLPPHFLAELVCKTLFHAGRQQLADLSARLKLPARIVEELLDFLRRERLCEIASSSNTLQRHYVLTDTGRLRAQDYLQQSQYVGPAPVTLEAYQAQVKRQAIADFAATRADLEHAYAGIVVSGKVLDQLGAAMNSARSIFLYGPAGAGKSFLAEKLVRLLTDEIYVPYAILVRDQIVRVYDPDTHVSERPGAGASAAVSSPVSCTAATIDARWVRCRRPVIITGGELTLDMLELQFERGSRFYSAPPQLKANNGLLIVDDLGRQKVAPRDLMNRWIVPLDRRIDYLALHTGEKVLVPFDVTVVFCTNISPGELADEAFLRRLGYKIAMGALDEAQYREVCAQTCAALGIEYDAPVIDRLIARFHSEGRPLLACTPYDLLRQARDRARYRGGDVRLSDELLAWAWDNYFVSAIEPVPVGAQGAAT
jgi:hypothetical protein